MRTIRRDDQPARRRQILGGRQAGGGEQRQRLVEDAPLRERDGQGGHPTILPKHRIRAWSLPGGSDVRWRGDCRGGPKRIDVDATASREARINGEQVATATRQKIDKNALDAML